MPATFFKELVSRAGLALHYLKGNRVTVVAGVVERDGRILVARRKSPGRLGGKWEFPGGKLEPGETPEECLRRELKEEFDIDTEVSSFLCSVSFRYFLVPIHLDVYKAKYLSGGLKLTAHDRAQWAGAGELDGFDFIEADRTVIKKMSEKK